METGLPEKLCLDYKNNERTTMPVSSDGILITPQLDWFLRKYGFDKNI